MHGEEEGWGEKGLARERAGETEDRRGRGLVSKLANVRENWRGSVLALFLPRLNGVVNGSYACRDFHHGSFSTFRLTEVHALFEPQSKTLYNSSDDASSKLLGLQMTN